jgi:hypothetical protein
VAAGKGNGWAGRPPQVGAHRTAGSATLSTKGTLGYSVHKNVHRNATVNTPQCSQGLAVRPRACHRISSRVCGEEVVTVT